MSTSSDQRASHVGVDSGCARLADATGDVLVDHGSSLAVAAQCGRTCPGCAAYIKGDSSTEIEATERDCSVIRPHAGHLIFYGGRRHPQYARALASDSDTRIVVVMNFYTTSYPESTRPRDLNMYVSRLLHGPGEPWRTRR